MKLISILLLMCSCAGAVLGQQRWTILERPTAANLQRVSFIDTLNGWVAGDSGQILRTTNGGVFWEFQKTGILNEIHELFMLNQTYGWALAFKYPFDDTTSYGTILLRTTNGGASWGSQSNRITQHLNAVSFVGGTTGIAVGHGGTIIRTTNAGDLWLTQTSGSAPWTYYGTSFTDTNAGTVVGSHGTILRTTNGGSTWETQQSGTTLDLLDVCFIDAATGTVVGRNGRVLRTINGGSTWTSQTTATIADLHDVFFVDVNTGIAVGDSGTILRTSNGGDVWTSQTSGTTALLHAVAFPDGNTGTVTGGGGTILRTTNGGTTWVSQTSGATVDLRGVFFVNPDTGVVVGNGGTILHTTNGGATWTSQLSGTLLDLFDVHTDGVTATAVGQNGRILHTANAGATWIHQDYPVQFFYATVFRDSANGLMGGERGAILKTTDGGVTWSPVSVQQTIASGFPVRHFDFFSNTYGFALGGHMDLAGVVWKTTTGGDHWTATSESGEPIHALHFIDSLNLVAVGGDLDFGSGMIRSTNAGRNWEYTYLGIFGEARAISFRTLTEGYAPLGFTGTYMVTTDTGSTWSQVYSPDSTAMRDVVFIDSTHGFMVGNNGTILKYNSTVVSVDDLLSELPLVPILHQNYPNPFNPTTAIRFELSGAAFVTLRVCDAAGREVTRFVLGRKEPGAHSIEFSGEAFASGVYFYELTTSDSRGRTTQVRKMVLLK